MAKVLSLTGLAARKRGLNKVAVVGSTLALYGIAQNSGDPNVNVNLVGAAAAAQVAAPTVSIPISEARLGELSLTGLSQVVHTRLDKTAHVSVALAGVEARGQAESMEGADITVYIDPVFSLGTPGPLFGGAVPDDIDYTVEADIDDFEIKAETEDFKVAAETDNTHVIAADADTYVVPAETDTYEVPEGEPDDENIDG